MLTDNGGASTIGQNWNAADLLSATLMAGTYSANYAPLIAVFEPVFRTDAFGVLDQVNFLGGFGLSDSFGIGGATLLFDIAILDYYGNPAVLDDPLSSQGLEVSPGAGLGGADDAANVPDYEHCFLWDGGSDFRMPMPPAIAPATSRGRRTRRRSCFIGTPA